jgi:hypothetical protein
MHQKHPPAKVAIAVSLGAFWEIAPETPKVRPIAVNAVRIDFFMLLLPELAR